MSGYPVGTLVGPFAGAVFGAAVVTTPLLAVDGVQRFVESLVRAAGARGALADGSSDGRRSGSSDGQVVEWRQLLPAYLGFAVVYGAVFVSAAVATFSVVGVAWAAVQSRLLPVEGGGARLLASLVVPLAVLGVVFAVGFVVAHGLVRLGAWGLGVTTPDDDWLGRQAVVTGCLSAVLTPPVFVTMLSVASVSLG